MKKLCIKLPSNKDIDILIQLLKSSSEENKKILKGIANQKSLENMSCPIRRKMQIGGGSNLTCAALIASVTIMIGIAMIYGAQSAVIWYFSKTPQCGKLDNVASWGLSWVTGRNACVDNAKALANDVAAEMV
jgi:hypothetical protein